MTKKLMRVLCWAAVGSSAWFGRLWCRLGAHKWGVVGYNSILNPMPVEQCRRCKIGRQFHLVGAEFYYSAEQMRGLNDGDPVANQPDVTRRPNVTSSATPLNKP